MYILSRTHLIRFILIITLIYVTGSETVVINGEKGTDVILHCNHPRVNSSSVGQLQVQLRRERRDDPNDVQILFMHGRTLSATDRISITNMTTVVLKDVHIEDGDYAYKCMVTLHGKIWNTVTHLKVTDKSFGRVNILKGRYRSGKFNTQTMDLKPSTVLRYGATLMLSAESKAFRPPAKLLWSRNNTQLLSNGIDVHIESTLGDSEFGYGTYNSKLTYDIQPADDKTIIKCQAVGEDGQVLATADLMIFINFNGACCHGVGHAETTTKPPDNGETFRGLDGKMLVILLTGVGVFVLILIILLVLLLMEFKHTRYKLLQEDERRRQPAAASNNGMDTADGIGEMTGLDGETDDKVRSAREKMWRNTVRKMSIRRDKSINNYQVST